MKKFIITGLVMALCAGNGAIVKAQSAPGWGVIKQISGYSSLTSQFGNEVKGIGQDAAGNMYVAGSFIGNPIFDTTTAACLGETDIFVAKYSAAGSLLWLRQIRGTGVEMLFGFGVAANGRCILSGSCSGISGGDISFGSTPMLVGSHVLGPGANGLYEGFGFMASIDGNGVLEWSNSMYPSGVTFTGFTFDNRGNCYGSGWSTTSDDLGGQLYPRVGNQDALLAKINPATGGFGWVRRVGAVGGDAMATKLLIGASGALYWAFDANRTTTLDGITAPVSTIGGSCLVKLTPNNRVLWLRNDLAISQNIRCQGVPLAVDEAANAIYFQGGTPYNGNTTVTFPGGTVAPYTVPAGNAGWFVAVCDTGGVAVTRTIPLALGTPAPGTTNTPGLDLAQLWVTANSLTYVTNGGGDGNLAFLPGGRPLVANDGSLCVGQRDNAPARLSWVRRGGTFGPSAWGGNNSYVVGAVKNAAGNIWVAGNFQGTATFGNTTITSATSIRRDMFLAELDMAIVTGVKVQATGVAWSVFPNPSAGAATLTGLPAQAQVRVYDAQGRLVRALGAVATTATPRTVTGLAPGLYLLQAIETPEPYQLQRLVVE